MGSDCVEIALTAKRMVATEGFWERRDGLTPAVGAP